MKTFQLVRLGVACAVLLAGLLLAGCAYLQQQQTESKQRFAASLDRLVGKVTYEQMTSNWGPPTERRETVSEISGIWEDVPGNVAFTFSPEKNMGGDSGYREWRVKMIFDRKSMLLKSWEEVNR